MTITKPNIIWNEIWIEVLTDFFAKIEKTNEIRNQFVIVSWPSNIWKSTTLLDLSHQLLWNSADRDLLYIRDLSDIWSNIKESNKLTGRSHIIKIESDKIIKIDKNENYTDFGAREINNRLSISPSSNFKIVLMENIERMNEESANAFLKNLEEPLANRLIVATTSNINQVLPTIKSRWFLYQRNLVDKKAINIYISEKYPDLSSFDLSNILEVSAWRPGLAIKLAEDLNLLNDVISFYKLDKNSKYRYLKNLNDKWDVYGFLDIYIWYESSKDPSIISKYLKFIKYNNANLWVDNILFDLVMN